MRENETELVDYEDQWDEQDEWQAEADDGPRQDVAESQVVGASERKRRNPLASMAVRRSLGAAIALAMAYGIFHVIFRTDVLAPALAYVDPVKDGIDWVLADPSRAWMALAALAIPHIGAYYLIFEDRR